MGEVAERFRKVELEAFTSMAAASGIDLDEFPPDALLLIMMAIPTTVVYEEAIGMSTGHEHALMLVERYLAQFRGAPLRRPTTKPGSRRGRPTSTRNRRGRRRRATSTKKSAKKVAKKVSEAGNESGEADQEGDEAGQEGLDVEPAPVVTPRGTPKLGNRDAATLVLQGRLELR